MIKFIKIIIDKNRNNFVNIEYLPQIIMLYKKFSRNLNDDYFMGKTADDIEKIIDVVSAVSPYFWVIVDEKENFSGFIFLDNWVGSKSNPHSAEVTTCFKQDYWGVYTKICARKFIKYCFKKYKLKKIKAVIFPQNYKVKTLLRFSGFRKEALLKNETMKDGKPQDIEIYSIIKEKSLKKE